MLHHVHQLELVCLWYSAVQVWILGFLCSLLAIAVAGGLMCLGCLAVPCCGHDISRMP